MAIGRTLHWIGVSLALAAAGCLMVSTIGAPVVNDIGLLKVTLRNASDIRQSSVVFGPFGYCVLDVAPPQTDQDYCPKSSIGYLPAEEMRLLDPATTWTTWTGHTLDVITVTYVLLPIAFGFAFVGAVFAFCGAIGSIIAAFLCFMAWICSVAAMIMIFISMGDLKDHVIAAGLSASYSFGTWTCMAAAIALFFAMFFLFISCCSGERGKRKDKKSEGDTESHHQDDTRSSRISHHEHTSDKNLEKGYVPAAAAADPYTTTSREDDMKGNRSSRGYDHEPMNEKQYEGGYKPSGVAGVPFGRTPRQPSLKEKSTNGYVPAAAVGAVGRNENTGVTHHLPTQITTTTSYPDGKGGFNHEMQTTSHDPYSEKSPGYTR